MKDRTNAELKKASNTARKQKQEAFDQHFEEKVTKFLEETDKAGSLDAMVKTFRFIKTHRRKNEKIRGKFIHIRDWEKALREQTSTETLQMIPEDDGLR